MTPLVQALVAITIVLITWLVIIPASFKGSAKVAGNKVKLSVPIIEGKIIMNNNQLVIDTSDPNQIEYVSLPPSNNLKGGIQYSYSMWMNKLNISSSIANRILFMRGLTTTSQVATLDTSSNIDGVWTNGTKIDTNLTKFKLTSTTNGPLVKQPLVKFGDNENELKIQFNTIKNPTNEIIITGDMMNKLNTNAWYLLTFTFQDGYGIDGFENGVMIKFFINDKEMMTQTIPNDALIINQDPVYILPTLNVVDPNVATLAGSMADITYHNYALSQDDMLAIVLKGFNNMSYMTPGMKKSTANASKYYTMTLNNSLQNL